jgi:hypothetical protein
VRFRRGWIIASVLVAVISSVAVVSLWRGWAVRQACPGETVWLGDGLVMFQMPQGWQQRACDASRMCHHADRCPRRRGPRRGNDLRDLGNLGWIYASLRVSTKTGITRLVRVWYVA